MVEVEEIDALCDDLQQQVITIIDQKHALEKKLEQVAVARDKWKAVRFYDVAAMQLRNSFIAELEAVLGEEKR